jgi:hypothetical protein
MSCISLSKPPDPIIAALRRAPDLFKIPEDELEKMVGEVVREPGFIDFLEKVEKMWKIRSFIGR